MLLIASSIDTENSGGGWVSSLLMAHQHRPLCIVIYCGDDYIVNMMLQWQCELKFSPQYDIILTSEPLQQTYLNIQQVKLQTTGCLSPATHRCSHRGKATGCHSLAKRRWCSLAAGHWTHTWQHVCEQHAQGRCVTAYDQELNVWPLQHTSDALASTLQATSHQHTTWSPWAVTLSCQYSYIGKMT